MPRNRPPPTASLGLQHLAHARAEHQVGVADDRLGDAAWAVIAGRAHRRDAVDEFDLAHRRHLARAVLAIHRLAFEEHRGDDVVAAADVVQQFGQEVAAAMRRIPEMMVRIDDRQIRLQRRLARTLRQPCPQVGVAAVRTGHDSRPWSLQPFFVSLLAGPRSAGHAACAVSSDSCRNSASKIFVAITWQRFISRSSSGP